MEKISPSWLNRLVKNALKEDLGSGDLTTSALIPSGAKACGLLEFKEAGVLAGLFLAELVFKQLNPQLEFTPLAKDGDWIPAGGVVAGICGKAAFILTGERTALNFLQHLSGIATLTARYCEVLKNSKTVLLDTRKTLPGFRRLEKYAVKMGGGENHRMGLYDGVLIKNNHLKFAPSITKAIKKVREKLGNQYKIEVEVETLSQLKAALSAGADIIMLDNMGVKSIKEAVKLAKGKAKIELSGGISLENLKLFAPLGADFISAGALTHSAPALDIHLKLNPLE